MKSNYKLLLSALAIVFALSSCEKSEDEPKGEFENGTFITNEGTWGNSNASVSFISEKGEVKESIFKEINGYAIGDVLQSMTIDGDFAYLVVNASNKVEVVNSYTFTTEGVITDIESPRYLVEENNKLFISQWGKNGAVEVVDAKTFSIIKIIEVGFGPEGIIDVNDEIWVANSGGFGSDKTISIIDVNSLEVSEIITLEGDDPKNMVVDSEGDVWVLCSGHITYNADWSVASETPSMLIEINASDKSIKKSIVLSATVHPNHVKINDAKNKIYYGGGYGVSGIFEISTSATTAPTEAFIEGNYYGFNIDEYGHVFGAIAPDFSSNGEVKEFDTSGKEIVNYTAGVGPNGVVFNN